MNLDDADMARVDRLHARYLIGFWRKAFFARMQGLLYVEEDPPIVNELRSMLFWADDDQEIESQVKKLYHVRGLEELITRAEARIIAIRDEISEQESPGVLLDEARRQLQLAESARQLLEIMNNA